MAILEEIIKQFLTTQQPWWIYALLGLVPVCILISIREFSCWFWKVNKIVGRLDRIEKQLRNSRLGSQSPEDFRSNEARTKIANDRERKGPSEL